MKTEYIVITGKETVVQSFVKDSITFGFLLFSIWVSRGSRTWTVICGLMFLVFIMGKSMAAFGNNHKKFKTKEELIDWAKTGDN